MMDRITKKCLLRIKFKLLSPLIIGSGVNVNSDNDIILKNGKEPFIPGTAIAGAIRSLAENNPKAFSNEEMKEYFGFVAINKSPDNNETEPPISSRIVFYDGNLDTSEQNQYHISKRDCVSLDEWKTAKRGAKFDMQVLEAGAVFETYIEQNFDENYSVDYTDLIASWWKQGNVCFGSKTTRGFGRIEVIEIKKLEIYMNEPASLDMWLNHNMYDEALWQSIPVYDYENKGNSKTQEIELNLNLQIVSSMSIRRYSTEVGKPDYMQIKSHGKDGKIVAVIPGTTWAGAFRHHMDKLIKGSPGNYFGVVNYDRKIKKKSNIIFSESEIQDSKPKILTRNAIDRFSGGTVEGALYTESTEYGGTTELQIKLCKTNISDAFISALAASVADLHAGILSIGGLTAVGRGLFKVVGINENEFNGQPEELYELVRNHLKNEIDRIQEEVQQHV